MQDDYRTHYEATDDQRTELVSCPYFTTALYNLTKAHTIELASLDSFVIVICTEGEGTITDNNGEQMQVRQGESILVPATATSLDIVPNGKMKILTSHI